MVDACICVFALGYSEQSLRDELAHMASTAAATDRLCETVSLVFITLSCLPAETVTRWSAAAPVSEATLARWAGFTRMIVDAYLHQGYAWYSVARLQLEQSLTLGSAEPAPVVAERMSLIYATLNTAAPRFP